jgi:hypothetical protein
MAEGVVVWREEILTFFVNVVSSSTNLRLLPGWSTPSGNIVAISGRDGVSMVYYNCSWEGRKLYRRVAAMSGVSVVVMVCFARQERDSLGSTLRVH